MNETILEHSGKDYVLVTAAYNEEDFIEKPLASVVAQTVRPRNWIIVSDGSTDRTDQIVQSYTEKHDFIRLYRINEGHPRNFAAQVYAINTGFSLLREERFALVGNLDADISLEPTYFEQLLDRFEQDPSLGLGGGYIYERIEGEFQSRKMNTTRSVPHAVQLFRRECLEALGGGYTPLPYGGPDWHAEVSLRMLGWRVQSFVDLPAYHHRPTGTVGGLLRTCYREGLMDQAMGCHPLFEVFRLGRRLLTKPVLIGSLTRLGGFTWAHCMGRPRCVSNEFAAFLRREEMERLQFWRKASKNQALSDPSKEPMALS